MFCDGSEGNCDYGNGGYFASFCEYDLLKIRQRLAKACEQASPLNGSVEVDESNFGVQRLGSRRGGGA